MPWFVGLLQNLKKQLNFEFFLVLASNKGGHLKKILRTSFQFRQRIEPGKAKI
jgi:hypothetical protein